VTLLYEQYRASNYFRALDGLRAVSILLVLVLHTNPQLWARVNGGVGVYVFFVISGYLITTLSLREETKRGALSLRSFYIRRACRILPLYYLVLLFYVVLVAGLNYHGHRHLLLQGLPYFLFYMNDLTPNLDAMPFAHSWSLGVEEKFYIAWPVIGFVLWRGRTALRVAGLLGLIFGPFVLEALHLWPFEARLYGWPLYYAYSAILTGCLLAVMLHHRRSYAWAARFGSGAPAWFALAVFLTGHVLVDTSSWTLFFYPFAVAIGMIPLLLGRAAWVRWLETRPMVFIGIRSYGIYLVHMMCLSVVLALARHVPGITFGSFSRPIGPTAWPASLFILGLGFGSALLVAAALNVVVERPMIALGRRLTRSLTGAEPIAPGRGTEPHAHAGAGVA
jgi:peptidoglycan/LPS O-acetylase OafA/YrhL